MNSIKFIEKEIDYCWSKYEFHKNEPTSDFNNAAMKLYSEKIEYLNQVKTIIEAWEVVKQYCDYHDGDPFVGIPEGFYLIKPIKGNDFLIVRKALEIKKERNE